MFSLVLWLVVEDTNLGCMEYSEGSGVLGLEGGVDEGSCALPPKVENGDDRGGLVDAGR